MAKFGPFHFFGPGNPASLNKLLKVLQDWDKNTTVVQTSMYIKVMQKNS